MPTLKPKFFLALLAVSFHVQEARAARGLADHGGAHVHQRVRRANQREEHAHAEAVAVPTARRDVPKMDRRVVVLGVPVEGIPALVAVVLLCDTGFDREVGSEVGEDPNHHVHWVVRAPRLHPRPGKEEVPHARQVLKRVQSDGRNL